MPHEDYCIKQGYRPNLELRHIRTNEAGVFWNASRIRSATRLQYHVYDWARRFFPEKGGRLMDVGCGPPLKLRRVLGDDAREVVLVDQPGLANLAGEILPQARFIGADLERIDLGVPGAFDVILCVDVLEHLVSPERCLEFIRAHLLPSGTALLSTPERDVLRGTDCDRSPKAEHVREWNAREFAAWITKRGFDVVETVLLPQIRLTSGEFLLSRMLSSVVRSRRWSSCQVHACRVADSTVSASG
jgi:2-polyprenyl-3-methyl-5-hydroxy-6-metoxy-1,4-benzoquinol methylase